MRRLTPDWRARAEEVLDRRLRPAGDAPLAVAFSGGGDSLALLLIVDAWARRHGRRVLALTVDHGLQPAGADWARWCGERAARLGVDHRTLVWEGDKPVTGIPAAARVARHALLADAARQAGSRVVLMGHTADDLAESAAMRGFGSSVPDAREWAPSPAWPEGRGVFIQRPLLGARRSELRDGLREQGETWIEDPANDDPRFARARARSNQSSRLFAAKAVIQAGCGASASSAIEPEMAWLPTFAGMGGGETGGLVVHQGEAITRAALSVALVCAGGGATPPRGVKLDRLHGALGARGAATLAGAKAIRAGKRLIVARDLGRQGLPCVTLPLGEAVVWDGRFEIVAREPGLSVGGLGGSSARLSKADRVALRQVPAPLRQALPAITDAAGAVTCPILAEDPRVRVRSLVAARFLAATGHVAAEPDA